MTVHILKADRDSDRYVLWSTTSVGPWATTCIGTRAELLSMLTPHDGYPGHTEERLVRADACGTSAEWSWSDADDIFGPPYFGSWDDPEPLSTQEDDIARDQLGAYLDTWLSERGGTPVVLPVAVERGQTT